MINGVSDALKLAGQLAPVSQSPRTSFNSQRQPHVIPVQVGQFRSDAFERWAKVTEAQHRISAAQLALEAQQKIVSQLKQMLSLLPGAMQRPEAQARLEQLRSDLSQRQVSYLGVALLDHRFNVRLGSTRPSRRRFKLKSINLTASKPRDEALLWQLPTADGPVALSIRLPADASPKALCALLATALAPHGISIELDDSEAEFACDETQWQQLKAGLLLRGQGQRLPAGESRQIKLQELYHWQDPREWDLASAPGLKQTDIKLQKLCRKLSGQIRQTQQQLTYIGDTLGANLASAAVAGAAAETAALLQSLELEFTQPHFAGQLTALLAQANLGRQQTRELLKTA